jgi:hypothetical protein
MIVFIATVLHNLVVLPLRLIGNRLRHIRFRLDLALSDLELFASIPFVLAA